MPSNIPTLGHFTPGVLAKDQLEDLIRKGHISGQVYTPDAESSAIDLKLGNEAWKLNTGQRPTSRELHKIQAQSEQITLGPSELFTFERNSIYIVQLDEHLDLPGNISGRATGKSSIGRLDVITRLLTSQSNEYDLVPPGYNGPLHLLLVPQTFTIQIAPGKSLNQLRLFSGSHAASAITREQMHGYGVPFWYTLRESSRDDYEPWPEYKPDPIADPVLMDLTVDLGDPDAPYIYRAKRNVTDPVDPSLKSTLDPTKFFDKVKVHHEARDRSVVLQQHSFYIMKSRERLHIPYDVAVEVVAISERIGDIRVHYAGFAHPGFGFDERPHGVRKGTPLIFEVRATDMPTKLYHKSLLARIQLFRMSKASVASSSPYNQQELKLSNVFMDSNSISDASWTEESGT